MTFHFAYPNVLPRQEEFIGCGRYTLCDPGALPGPGYAEVQGVPNTPNKIILNRVAQILAPQSYDSPRILVHKQDREEISYQGDSLDLAWFLTHVFRSCRLRVPVKSDIWCTGVVQLDSSGPYLLDVEQNGFYLKLSAFLDPSNRDLYFIVPLPNLTPSARRMCQKQQVEIRRIGSLVGKDDVFRGEGKVIITVASDELSLLLETLFTLPSGDGKRRWQRWLLPILAAAVLVAVVIWFNRSHVQMTPVIEPVTSEPSVDVVSRQPKGMEEKEEKVPVEEKPLQNLSDNASQDQIQQKQEAEASRNFIPSDETDFKVRTSGKGDGVRSEQLNIPIDYDASSQPVGRHWTTVPLHEPLSKETALSAGSMTARAEADTTQQDRPQPFVGMRPAPASEEKNGSLLPRNAVPPKHPEVKATGLGRRLTDEEW